MQKIVDEMKEDIIEAIELKLDSFIAQYEKDLEKIMTKLDRLELLARDGTSYHRDGHPLATLTSYNDEEGDGDDDDYGMDV